MVADQTSRRATTTLAGTGSATTPAGAGQDTRDLFPPGTRLRTDHHPLPPRCLAVGQRGDCGGDLRSIAGQRRDQPKPGLSEPGAFPGPPPTPHPPPPAGMTGAGGALPPAP